MDAPGSCRRGSRAPHSWDPSHAVSLVPFECPISTLTRASSSPQRRPLPQRRACKKGETVSWLACLSSSTPSGPGACALSSCDSGSAEGTKCNLLQAVSYAVPAAATALSLGPAARREVHREQGLHRKGQLPQWLLGGLRGLWRLRGRRGPDRRRLHPRPHRACFAPRRAGARVQRRRRLHARRRLQHRQVLRRRQVLPGGLAPRRRWFGRVL